MKTLNANQTELVVEALRNSLQDTLDYAETNDYEPGELELSFRQRVDLLRELDATAAGLNGKNSHLLDDSEGSTPIETLTATEETTRYHEHRADRADVALTAYAAALGELREIDLDHVRDLAQDLIHWIAQHTGEGDAPQKLEELVGLAVRDFPMELETQEA